MPRILSVNVGRVAKRATVRGALADTGIGKTPVDGPVAIGPRGLEGDESAWRSRERGDTAVHIFCRESYDRFRDLGAGAIPVPTFGENLTVEGYPETEARVGDLVRAGTALLRVNQPVIRCSWPVVVSGEKRISKWAMQEGMTGFYLDVVEPGTVLAGDRLDLVDRGPDGWTVSRLNALYAARHGCPEEVAATLALPELALRWKDELRERLAKAGASV